MARLLPVIFASIAIIAATVAAQALPPCGSYSALVPYTGIDIEIFSKATKLSWPAIQPCSDTELVMYYVTLDGELAHASRGRSWYDGEGSFPTVIGPPPSVSLRRYVPSLVRGPNVYVNFSANPIRPPAPTQAQWDMLASRVNMQFASTLPMTPQTGNCMTATATSDILREFSASPRVYIRDILKITVKESCDRVLWACVYSPVTSGPMCRLIPLAMPPTGSSATVVEASSKLPAATDFSQAFKAPTTSEIRIGFTTPTNPTIQRLTDLGLTLYPPAPFSPYSLSQVNRNMFVVGSASSGMDQPTRPEDGGAGWDSTSSWTGAAVGACLVAVLAIGVVAYRRRHNRSTLQESLGVTGQQGYSTL